jgi:hypothetical protein
MIIKNLLNKDHLQSVFIAILCFIIILFFSFINGSNHNNNILFIMQMLFILFSPMLYIFPILNSKVSLFTFIFIYMIYILFFFKLTNIVEIVTTILPCLFIMIFKNKLNVFLTTILYFTALILIFGAYNIFFNVSFYEKTVETLTFAFISFKGNNIDSMSNLLDNMDIELISFFAPTFISFFIIGLFYLNYKVIFLLAKKVSINNNVSTNYTNLINFIFIILAILSIIFNYKFVDKNINILYTTYNALFILSIFYFYLGFKVINKYITNLVKANSLGFLIFVGFVLLFILFFVYFIVLISIIGFIFAIINKQKYINN